LKLKNTFRILAPAKINLFLRVTHKRPDGYHDLRSLMCCVGLYDVLTLEMRDSGITVTCPHPQVPEDARNLTHQAADLYFSHAGIAGGVGITIDKHIPVAAGLGGGSSDAAAVLLALNRISGAPCSRRDLMVLGRRLGADVPYLIYRKPALATGIGDRLTPFAGLPRAAVVLVNPGIAVSTAWVYKNLNLRLTKQAKQLNYFSFGDKKFSFATGLHNDLETVTLPRFPVIGEVQNKLTELGARGVLMSGSGPTVFGVFADMKAARHAKRELARQASWQVHLTHLLT